jgi:hypothetical protein
LEAGTVAREVHGKQKDNEAVRHEYFKHISNHVARTHDFTKDLCPSDALHIFISNDQKRLLMPTMKDVIMGNIIDSIFGEHAVKKIARRCLDMVSGNVNCYARMLNNPAQMKLIQEHDELVSNLANIEQEKKKEKQNWSEKVQGEKFEKEARKFEKEKAFQGKKNELMKGMIDDVGKGIEHL